MTDSQSGKKVLSEPELGAKPGPRTIGGYQLLAKMGRDDMGTLYLARPDAPDQSGERVTIRQINEQLSADGEFVDAVVSETRVAAKINHPTVAAILDVGKERGRLFVVTEYVHGEDLGDVLKAVVLKHARFPWTHGVKIVADVAEGLHAAHSLTDSSEVGQRIVHRDVCPKNILVGYDGQVKVTDFGLAYAALKKAYACVGILKDKVGYWSPEQAEGGQLDHSSDIFSLGVVLFEAVTASRLFGEPSEAATLLKVRRAEVPFPRSLNPELPEDLEQVIVKALARDPEERFATAREMSERLIGVLTKHGKVIGYRQISEALAYFFRTRRQHKESLIQAALDRIESSAAGADPLDSDYVVEVEPMTEPADSADADHEPAEPSVEVDFDPDPADEAKKDFGADSPAPLRRVMTPSMKGQVMPAAGSAVSPAPDTGMTGAVAESPRRQVRHLFTGVIVVALFLLVAFGAVMLGRTLIGSKKPAASSGAKKAQASQSMKVATRGKAGSSGTKDSADVILEVSIQPKEAAAVATWRGEAHYGTSVKFVVPRSSQPERLKIEAPGYRTEVVVVVPAADTKLSVTLKPGKSRSRKRRGKKRKKRKGRRDGRIIDPF